MIVLKNLKFFIAKQFGIADSISINESKKLDGIIHSRGSDNYANDEAKGIARLKKELKDTQDSLYVLKKAIGILGK
ncbi:hypothetical protein B5E48_05005 [Massilimicrobiota sp. An105]|uniref:hypothetical protein n=1 Tax=Massilimicrobiota sp. An105 TaxID=1965540 RepID=UPI000B54B223|nr:hypothetical protein [Massilimicrobiota sp. An105]OUQ80742.1 hypothetical protein B5E48_05005 [Massilimicrobiota sp. An105]